MRTICNGNDDERVAEHLLLLGITESRQDKHAAAVVSLSRALQIYRKVSGHDHMKTAVTMGHLARARLEVGDLATAATLESLSRGQRLFLLQEAAGAPPPKNIAKTRVIPPR